MKYTHRFRSTKEALRFGRTATKKDIKELKLERTIYTAQYKRLKDSGQNLFKTFDRLFVLTTQIQYCNEALSVAKGG